MLLPQSRFLEQDDSTGREIALRKSPSLQLSRVNAITVGCPNRRWNDPGIAASEDFHHQVGSGNTRTLKGVHVSADNARAKEGIVRRIDRGARCFPNVDGDFSWSAWPTAAVHEDRQQEHYSFARQPRHLCEKCIIGKPRQVSDIV